MKQGRALNKIITSLQESRANVMRASKKPTDSRHLSVCHLTFTHDYKSDQSRLHLNSVCDINLKSFIIFWIHHLYYHKNRKTSSILASCNMHHRPKRRLLHPLTFDLSWHTDAGLTDWVASVSASLLVFICSLHFQFAILIIWHNRYKMCVCGPSLQIIMPEG